MTPLEGPGPSEPSRHRRRAVRELYDRWARVYDWNPAMALVRPARRHAVAALELSPGDTAVDMGTGTGANLRYLRDAVGPGGTVVGIDISPKMLARARRRVAGHGWTNVTLVEGDIRDPPVEGPVDGVLSTFVVVMYPDPDRLVEAWADRLGAGTIANLYAGPSGRAYGPAVNGLLRLYLRLFEAGWATAGAGPSPFDVIRARGERARRAVAERMDRFSHEELVFGLAHLDVGRVDGP